MRDRRYIPWRSRNPAPWASVWLECVGWRDCKGYNVDAATNYFCTHLIANGSIRFQTGNGVDVVLGPDDLFSMWPGISWRLHAEPPCKDVEVDIDWVRVKGPAARDFMRLMGTTEDHPWARAVRPKEARALMRRLQTLATDYPPQADLTAVGALHHLAAACAVYRPDQAKNRSVAEKIREAMEQHVRSGMNVTDYARAFRISRSAMFLKFKETFKKSPIEVLEDIRFHCAMSLLQQTDMSVSEVASSAGYRNPVYFSRHFRNRTGKSPSQFRPRRH
jgi:AraC-like DNA-binding protein